MPKQIRCAEHISSPEGYLALCVRSAFQHSAMWMTCVNCGAKEWTYLGHQEGSDEGMGDMHLITTHLLPATSSRGGITFSPNIAPPVGIAEVNEGWAMLLAASPAATSSLPSPGGKESQGDDYRCTLASHQPLLACPANGTSRLGWPRRSYGGPARCRPAARRPSVEHEQQHADSNCSRRAWTSQPFGGC